MKKLLNEIKEGDSFIAFAGVLSKTLRKTKDDKPYYELVLCDKTRTIEARIWDNVKELGDKFEQGDIVAIKGVATTFNNELQLKIENIRRVDPIIDQNYGYDEKDIILTTSKNVDELWQDLMKKIGQINDPYLRQVTENIYQEYAEKLKNYPGSMRLHHAYRGGLIEHIHALVSLGEYVCQYYTGLDRDLLISGLLLHDIGKLYELAPKMITTEYSDEGNFIGHIVLGYNIVHEACLKIPGFPELLRLKLEHIILAHQGRYEWHSPREPIFLEALIVYYLDEMDTRINQMKKDIEEDLSEGMWTTRTGYFKRVLFKGENGTKGEK